MKKSVIIFALLMVVMSASAQDRKVDNSKAYNREGNTFVQSATAPSEGDQMTAYLWRDKEGNEYPIILHTYVKGEKAGRVTCYVVRTSKKGNQYKYYLPQGEEIAKEILTENR